MNVAVIPARGGSKRIPRKNVREFAGKPMIAHSIGKALECGLFDRVLVSTDDAEIAEVARAHGAEVPFLRPAALSDDRATTTDVIAHATRWLADQGTSLAAVCCIYATAPLMRIADLRGGFELFRDGDWQYVFAAAAFPYPILRSFRQDSCGGVEMLFPEHSGTRSQDLPEALHDAGQFYWGRPHAWTARVTPLGPTSTVVRIPHWLALDLDTPEDWERLELMCRVLATATPASRARG